MINKQESKEFPLGGLNAEIITMKGTLTCLKQTI